MTAWLRLLGIGVLALGIGGGTYAGTLALGDVSFAETAAQYERHRENLLFQADYYPAAARHYGLVAGAVAGIVGGVVFGSLLLGLAAVLARLGGEGDRAPETKKAG